MSFLSKLSNPKILLPLLGVFIVLILGGAYYYYQVYLPAGGRPFIGEETSPPPPGTPPPSITPEDPTAGWASYTAPTLKYSIKYPSGWYVTGDEHPQRFTNYNPQTEYGAFPNQIEVAVQVKDLEGKTLSEWMAAEDTRMGKTIVTQKEITVDGVAGIHREETWGQEPPGTRVAIYLSKSGKAYVISAIPPNSPHIDKFDLMVTTFKFNL